MGDSSSAQSSSAMAAGTDGTEDGKTTTDAVVLRADGIEKSYNSVWPFTRDVDVLTGASLSLERNSIVGIIGENGSGKSTLLKILVGVLESDVGTVAVEGSIGWCPQEPRLYDRLTISETFQLFGQAHGMTSSEIQAAEQRLADRLDFEQFLDYQIRHLSGGNRQKVNLSVALIHDPDVLLLDEPYTGFDWETYLEFWELAEDLVERGVSIAIISHILNERERFDGIYKLDDGKLHWSENDEL